MASRKAQIEDNNEIPEKPANAIAPLAGDDIDSVADAAKAVETGSSPFLKFENPGDGYLLTVGEPYQGQTPDGKPQDILRVTVHSVADVRRNNWNKGIPAKLPITGGLRDWYARAVPGDKVSVKFAELGKAKPGQSAPKLFSIRTFGGK